MLGERVGKDTGESVKIKDGLSVGIVDGDTVEGLCVGVSVGSVEVDAVVGLCVGLLVGWAMGDWLGAFVGGSS